MKILRQINPIASQSARIDMIAEAIDRTLKLMGISSDPATWSPETRAWAAQQPGLLGLSEKASEQSAENPTSASASTDRGEDSK